MPQTPASQWYPYLTGDEYIRNAVASGEGRGRIHCRYPPSRREEGRHIGNAARQRNQVTGEGTQVTSEVSQDVEVIASRPDQEAPIGVSRILLEEETPHSLWSILESLPTLLPPSPHNYRQRKRPAMSDGQDAIELEPKRTRIEPSNEASQALPIEAKNIQNDAEKSNQDTGDTAAPPTLLLPPSDNYQQCKRPAISDDQDAVESEPKRTRIEPSNEASQALPIEAKNIQNDAEKSNQDTGDTAAPPTLLLPPSDNYQQCKRPAISDDQDAVESEPKRTRIEPSNEASQALPIEAKDIQNDAKEGNQVAGDIAAPSEPNTPNTPIPIRVYRSRRVKLPTQAPVRPIMS
ncbi:hypothetical protein HOY82DRAFT_540385 [Tuber indicum]|nr:hypothetical protein HOY82DRAFT_540385 [Tuber indicum]